MIITNKLNNFLQSNIKLVKKKIKINLKKRVYKHNLEKN